MFRYGRMPVETKMIDLIENHRSELTALCRKHRVKTLEVFGSAANGAFDP